MSKYVNQLPKDIQDAIKYDAIAILENITDYSHDEIMDIVNNVVMNEKLININFMEVEKMKNVYGEYFNGAKISDYGLEHGYVDYATLAKNIDAVMCNDFMEQTFDIGYWYQISGMIDYSEEIEELEDQIAELEDQIDDPEGRSDIEDQIAKLEDQIEELREEEERYPEIFQWFITDYAGAEVLELNNEIIYYNETLDLYLWGVTHFGTSWSYVLTDIKCNTGTF